MAANFFLFQIKTEENFEKLSNLKNWGFKVHLIKSTVPFVSQLFNKIPNKNRRKKKPFRGEASFFHKIFPENPSFLSPFSLYPNRSKTGTYFSLLFSQFPQVGISIIHSSFNNPKTWQQISSFPNKNRRKF